MTIALHTLHPSFGAEVLGVDLDEQQIAFSRRFGPREQTIKHIATNEFGPLRGLVSHHRRR